MAPQITRLRVNRVACSGHGACAELLPELIRLDDWGYPLLARDGEVPVRLVRLARRAVTDCPALALSLTSSSFPAAASTPASSRPIPRGSSEGAQMPGRGAGRKLGT